MKATTTPSTTTTIRLVYVRPTSYTAVSMLLMTWCISSLIAWLQFEYFHLMKNLSTTTQQPFDMVDSSSAIGLSLSDANATSNRSISSSSSSSSVSVGRIKNITTPEEAQEPSSPKAPPATTATATATTTTTRSDLLLDHPPRYAVAQFIDNPSHLYGLYSIKTQMERFNMTESGIGLVAVVPNEFPSKYPKSWEVLNQLLLNKPRPAANNTNRSNNNDTATATVAAANAAVAHKNNNRIYQVDTQYIHQRLTGHLWKKTFNKLWLFNMTDWDKLIVLDCDILVRQSLLHWFDYPTPAATQPMEVITWNSGAMVISPNTTVFDQMMQLLPKVRAPHVMPEDGDNWNTWISDQGFLSSFFSSKLYGGDDPAHRMKTLPMEASVLSKNLIAPHFKYWIKHRRHIIETVHFTKHKPWKEVSKYDIICDMFKEWVSSMEGVERYYPGIPPLPNGVNYCLRNCANKE